MNTFRISCVREMEIWKFLNNSYFANFVYCVIYTGICHVFYAMYILSNKNNVTDNNLSVNVSHIFVLKFSRKLTIINFIHSYVNTYFEKFLINPFVMNFYTIYKHN